MTAQLEHAHILHVYDTGAYDGRPYIVMELASGRTLADRLDREGQLPTKDTTAFSVASSVGNVGDSVRVRLEVRRGADG